MEFVCLPARMRTYNISDLSVIWVIVAVKAEAGENIEKGDVKSAAAVLGNMSA